MWETEESAGACYSDRYSYSGSKNNQKGPKVVFTQHIRPSSRFQTLSEYNVTLYNQQYVISFSV